MGIGISWQTTLAFRKFREKTHELSRMYWTQELCVCALSDAMDGKCDTDIPAQFVNATFKPTMFGENVAQIRNWLPEFKNRIRLQYLVSYTAFLEQYLKDITTAYTWAHYPANMANVEQSMKFTAIGEALSSRILKVSTVSDMLDYAEELFDVDFNGTNAKWRRLYKLRCAGAHLGGVATKNFMQSIGHNSPLPKPTGLNHIGLTWDELRTGMRLADEMAATIDVKVSSRQIMYSEMEMVLRDLFAQKALPPHIYLPRFLFDEFSILGIENGELSNYVSRFYEKRKLGKKCLLVPRYT